MGTKILISCPRWHFCLTNFFDSNVIQSGSRRQLNLIRRPQKNNTNKSCKLTPRAPVLCAAEPREDQTKAGQGLWKSPSLWDYLRLTAYKLWRTPLFDTVATIRFYFCKTQKFQELWRLWGALVSIKYPKKKVSLTGHFFPSSEVRV